MKRSDETKLSKFMSLVLRHAPEKAGLTLSKDGWVPFEDLATVLKQRFGASPEDIRAVVANNDKKRFVIENDRIRAAQGHSVTVDLGLQPEVPPEVLYHGTTENFWRSIQKEGLKPGSRQHVHLSPDVETARRVAIRRKGPHVILILPAKQLHSDGHVFYLSQNGVWLTDRVPADDIQLSERF